MRVIAGTARSLRLKTPEGMDTRPTTDRIKETLFNMLQPYLADAVFIDLYSGSGGMRIEALSRGRDMPILWRITGMRLPASQRICSSPDLRTGRRFFVRMF